MVVSKANIKTTPTPTFAQDQDGFMMCEGVRIQDIQHDMLTSPLYIYSKAQLIANYRSYENALEGLNYIIGYAIKANNNMHIVKLLKELGSGAVLVSGNELRLAVNAGIDMSKTIFNGNGKTWKELEVAVECGCLINIDSEFDLEHISEAAARVDKRANVLLRINPDIDANIHPYVSTGFASSKFGIRNTHLNWFLDHIKADSMLSLVGVHCHIGSTIKDVSLFHDAACVMIDVIGKIREQGFDNLKYLNIGGGLGIDYERIGEHLPTPTDLIDSIRSEISSTNLTIIVEPGRSMVGNTGILANTVIGVKTNGHKNFIVTDGSMAECLRPSLYDAYHSISLTEPGGAVDTFDIVGPVCESGDFLGKNRLLGTPAEGSGIAVLDAGAYCFSMASHYNMKPNPAEILVDGDDWSIIRRAETFDDLMAVYEE